MSSEEPQGEPQVIDVTDASECGDWSSIFEDKMRELERLTQLDPSQLSERLDCGSTNDEHMHETSARYIDQILDVLVPLRSGRDIGFTLLCDAAAHRGLAEAIQLTTGPDPNGEHYLSPWDLLNQQRFGEAVLVAGGRVDGALDIA